MSVVDVVVFSTKWIADVLKVKLGEHSSASAFSRDTMDYAIGCCIYYAVVMYATK